MTTAGGVSPAAGRHSGRRRELDLVLVGATGFTGGITAEYLARHAPASLRWAVAGRDQSRLAALRDRLGRIAERCADLPTVCVDLDDPASVERLAESTRSVASTAGPYVAIGNRLVAGCAAAGTDYLDICGESEFVDRTYIDHAERAEQTGARLVHCCGFESVPHDLGVLFTMSLLGPRASVAVDGFIRARAGLSAGTVHTAVGASGRVRRTRALAAERRRVERARGADATGGRQVRTVAGRPRHVPGSASWAVPLPTIDPTVVGRSARALDLYGPDFTYRHFAVVGRLPTAAAVVAGAGGLLLASRIPPVRRAVLGRRSAGDGPGPARRARSWFTARFVATTSDREVVTEVAGGDPGYDETAKMLAEAALCLLYDDVPATRGQVTTARAMGTRLITRLQAAGMTFRVVVEG
jgi:saccharopine dehydrogenase (NAD+, L-glutamate forming)